MHGGMCAGGGLINSGGVSHSTNLVPASYRASRRRQASGGGLSTILRARRNWSSSRLALVNVIQ